MNGLRLLTLMLICTLATTAQAWETQVDDRGPSQWRSLYQSKPVSAAAGSLLRTRINMDEHTKLADLALERIGAKLFMRGGEADLTLVDLNASYFRFEAMDGLPTEGDQDKTLLEKRRLPPPAHFSGIPDYSYTIYDWLNKNQLCPPGPENKLGKECHLYVFGWLGNLNSVHFGSQATDMYEHLHSLAITFAHRANTLHGKVRAAGMAEREAYKEHVREAELQALAYEGYAQHFLHDRWSIGHMWERWNGPDYAQIPDTDNIRNTMIGALSGIIHGSEAVLAAERDISIDPYVKEATRIVTGYNIASIGGQMTIGDHLLKADPMSSPIMLDGDPEPLTWRHTAASSKDKSLKPGLGDERLVDILDHKFGEGYVYYDLQKKQTIMLEDKPINVDEQFEELMSCSSAGWAEVIREFGQYDGGYGAWKVQLDGKAPTFKVLERESCWDMWATNDSIYEGFMHNTVISPKSLSRAAWWVETVAVTIVPASQILLNSSPLPRRDLVQLIVNIELAHDESSTGTDLAQGGIGPLGKFETGNHYALPDYAEPRLLEELPETSETGRDQQTLYGYFNRAHADHWCQKLPEMLPALRDSDEERDQQVCEYLADFAYEGTSEDYQGDQREHREDEEGTEIKSICAIQEKIASTDAEKFPRFIDQGYVPYGVHGKKQGRSETDFSYQSVTNWCNRVPVILLLEEAVLNKENIVAEVDADEESLELHGHNLGDLDGTVLIRDDGGLRPLGQIDRWQVNFIDLDIKDEELEPEKDYEIVLRRADGEESVGLFKLRVKEKVKIVEDEILLEGVGPCRIPLDIEELLTVDFTASIKGWKKLTVKAMEELLKVSTPFWEKAAALMEREAGCIDERWVANIPQNYDAAKSRAIFHDEGRYPPIIINEGERVNRVGDWMLNQELSLFSDHWGSVDVDLYRWHSKVLYAMAKEFREQPEILAEEIALAKELLEDAEKSGAEEDRKAIERQRQQLYEKMLTDYTISPAYMAYLSVGLNRWAVAEERLIGKVMPTLEAMRQERLAVAAKGAWQRCDFGWVPDSSQTNPPVDLLVSTPQFGPLQMSSELMHPYGAIPFSLVDRQEVLWPTPQRLQDIIGWKVNPDLFKVPRVGCDLLDSTHDRLMKMTGFEFIYGSQLQDLVDMGRLYEAKFRDIEGEWLPSEEDLLCVRCDQIETAINQYTQQLKHRRQMNVPVRFGTTAIWSDPKAAIPFIERRVSTLQGQLAKCRTLCTPTDWQAGPPKIELEKNEVYRKLLQDAERNSVVPIVPPLPGGNMIEFTLPPPIAPFAER